MSHPEIKTFLADICRRFPEVEARWQRWEDFMLTQRMEEFAALTTQELGKDDPSRGVAHLDYMSTKLRTATAKEREYIDTCYVEVLFFQSPDKTITRGWRLVPENLKQQFVAFHGGPPKTSKDREKRTKKLKRLKR